MINFLTFLYFFTLHADRLGGTVAGFTIRLNNLIAVGLAFFALFKYRPNLFIFDKKVIYAFLLLIFTLLLTVFFGHDPFRSTIFFGWFGFTFLLYFILPYLLFFYFDTQTFLKLYFLSFLAVGLYGFLQLFCSFLGFRDPFCTETISSKIVRPNAFCYEPSYYALYLTPFVITANLYYLLEKERPFFVFKKLKGRHIALINCFYLLSTSTAAFFALGIFLILLFYYGRKKWVKELYPDLGKKTKKAALTLFGFTLLLLGLFPKFAAKFFLKFFFHGISHHSFAERWEGIITGWKMFLEHPLVGVGFGGYPSYLYDKWLHGEKTFLFLKGIEINPLKVLEPTNVFIEIIASTGLIGSLGFIYLIFSYCREAKNAITAIKNKEARDLAFCFLISFLVMLIVLQFNQGVLRTYVWSFLAITFAYFNKDRYNYSHANYIPNAS